MTRLTNRMSDQIVDKLMDYRFSSDKKALQKQKHLFGEEVYKDLYSPGLREAMAALPKGFLYSRSRVLCQFGSETECVEFGSRKLIASKHYGSVAKIYDLKADRSKEFYKLKDIETELENKEDEAREITRRNLYNVQTVEELIQRWPECKPFVERVICIPNPVLPAPPIADINAMLGLKPINAKVKA